MKTLLLSLTILFSFSALAQPTFEWAKSMGSTSLDRGFSITTDASGNLYTTGYFKNTVDFDPGTGTFNLTSNGNTEIFIQKLDANGDFIWAKSMGSTGGDFGHSITTDASGNVYTTGYFEDTVDFDPGAGTFNLASNGDDDIFIQKLDANGNFIWAKNMGSTSPDQGHSITTDASGNVYTTGLFAFTVDFDPGTGTNNLTSIGGYDIFIQKLDANGNFIWAQNMGGTEQDFGRSITTDASGNVYTTGYFKNTVDFDPGAGAFNLTSNGYEDIFIQKLDANGNFIWAKSMGSTTFDDGWSITTDASGNVYTTGLFTSTVDFDPGAGTFNLTSNGGSDIFIQKLDANGNFIWAKNMGSTSSDQGRSITTDASGNVYTTGTFQNTVDFDPGAGAFNLTSNGSSDIFILKQDVSGNFIWAQSMGGTGHDFGHSITTDASGNVYTTGNFQDTVDFDPGAGTFNLTSNGSYDVFILKLSQCATSTGTDTQSACDSYLWIDGSTYTSSNNTATHTLTNAAGCDSLVTLDLTINTIDSSVTQNGIILTADIAGAAYQWLDCDNSFSIISGEINQSFTAASNGNYAVEITQNGCVDTSACYSVISVGIIENYYSNGLLIYPNPTDGNFFIDLGLHYESATVRVTDINGKLIQSYSYNDRQLLDMKIEAAAGVYLLMVESGDKKSVIRIVKE